jgi:hypothetical protein
LNFISTTRRKRSTATWRAILHGRGILKRGLIKRLGAGSSIDVWNDNWIPSNTSLKPMLKPDSATAIMVSELINDNDKPWNRDALVENFTPSDVEAIQKTHIK